MALASAAIAGTAAAAAYLDARYHIIKDLKTIRTNKAVAKEAQQYAKLNRRSFWYRFEDSVAARKNDTAIWYRSQPSEPVVQYTWVELHRWSCQWANFLLEQGVQPGELVSTYLINSPDVVSVMLGMWAIGTAPAWINYNLGGDGLVHCLKVAGSKVLIVDSEADCLARIEAVRDRIEGELGMRIIILDPATQARIASGPDHRPSNGYRDDVAGSFPVFLFYTSGTSGLPKACPFPTERAHVIGKPRLATTGLVPGDRWYDCMPLYHGTGGTTAICCMITGVTLCIGRKFSVRHFWLDVHDSGAHAFVYVGETARYLLAAPPTTFDKKHNLKAMYGNGMRPDVWNKFQKRFNIPCVNEFFNSTEGMLVLLNECHGPFHEAHVGHHGALQRRNFHNIFVPVQIDHENEAIWRDPVTGFARRMPYNEGGEILVACPSEKTFVGYWNDPVATEKRFERNVFKTGDLYYRTGDALRRDDDGRWFFMDRLGDTFRWKSENVSTAEVAAALGRFPGILEANVYGVEIPNHDGKAGCAGVYIAPSQRATFDWRGFLAHARKILPKYAVPVFVRVLDEQSPMHNNKQSKMPLRKEGIDPAKIATGDAGRRDVMYWVGPKGETYVPFSQPDLEALHGGKARL